MRSWKPSIASPWSSSDLEKIFDDALRVLEKIGVECTHEGVRKRLVDWGGVSLRGDRVCFAGARVRDFVDERRPVPEGSDDEDGTELSMGGSWAGLYYCDPETQEVRPGSSREAADMARFWDARGYAGSVPLMPGDVAPELVTLTAERIALTNSRNLGGMLTVSDPEEVRFLIAMNLAAGRRYCLMQQVGISPLRFDPIGLDTILAFLDNPDVDLSLAVFIPMAGVTCPLDPRSAIVQSVAESLALDILCSVLGITGGGFGIRLDPFDFQYAFIVFGSAEWCLYRVLVSQMNKYLAGRPESAPEWFHVRDGAFRSVAKRPNAQAACERTASVLWQALLGARHFGAVGQLSVDEVFSPQQAVLDGEILRYVERVARGLSFNSGVDDPVELIREGVQEGSFIGVADTVSRFREFYYFPQIFRHWNVGRWRAEGAPSILGEAWAQAKEEMAASTFKLADDQQKELDAVYEKAQRHVQSRS